MIATAAARASGASATRRSYRITRVGLAIDGRLSMTEWLAVGAVIGAHASALAWALGDWLVYGEARGDWGDTYGEAHRLTGKSFETLAQYDRVSRGYPVDERDPRVPWTLYRSALCLVGDERSRVLRVAAENAWQRRDMDAFLRGRETRPLDAFEAERATAPRKQRKFALWRPPESQAKKHRVECPNCGHQFVTRRSS